MKATTLNAADYEAYGKLLDKRTKLVAKYQRWKADNHDKSLSCKIAGEAEYKAMKQDLTDQMDAIINNSGKE